MTTELYNHVLTQFIALGRPEDTAINYIELGLNHEHWQVLAQIATDEDELYDSEDDNKFYATLHAGCALFQIDALAATPILLSQFYKADVYDDDWLELYHKLLTSLGAKILPLIYPQISTYLAQDRPSAAGWLVELIGNIAKHENEDIQASIIPVAESFLANYQSQDDFFNALVVSLLTTSKSVDSIDLIRQAFAANKVEIAMLGDVEDAEILLGLRTERETPRPSFEWHFSDEDRSIAEREEAWARTDRFANMPDYASPMYERPMSLPVIRTEPKIGRNDPCPCGSGKKYKKCCLDN